MNNDCYFTCSHCQVSWITPMSKIDKDVCPVCTRPRKPYKIIAKRKNRYNSIKPTI